MPNTAKQGTAISADGKMAAFYFSKGETPGNKIALVSLNAGSTEQARILEPDLRMAGPPEFTPDGKAVVYRIREQGKDNLWLQPLDGTPGRQITNFSTDSITQFQFSPDGKNLGVLRVHSESDVVLLRDSGPSPQ